MALLSTSGPVKAQQSAQGGQQGPEGVSFLHRKYLCLRALSAVVIPVLGFALADSALVVVNDAFLITGPEIFIADRRSYGRVCLISGVSAPAASKRRARFARITTRKITFCDWELADTGIYENEVAPISGAGIRQRGGTSAMAIHMMVMMLISVRLTGHTASLHFSRHRSTGAEQNYER
jgi:hypothetical protein